MRHKDAFWVTLLLVYFQAETSAIQLNGVLGESVTFQINDSKPFATISWSKTEKKDRFRVFALVAPGNPCKILVPIQAFKQRISSSKDCRNLQLSHLSQEDINRYRANIILTTSESINEHFDLKVYRRLQSTDLSIKCKISRGQTKLFHLMCSVEKWEDQLDPQWFVAEDLASHVTHESLLIINYTSSKIFDQEVSCKVENPVSKVSRNMTLSEACPQYQRSAIEKNMVVKVIIAGLSFSCVIIIVFITWLRPCNSRCLQCPGMSLSRTAEAAQPNPESPLPPPEQPPG